MKKKYGIEFDGEPDDIFIDLFLAKHYAEEPYKYGNLLEPQEHMLRACRALFTNREFGISPWSEEHAYDWCNSKFCITWGCASCSKSNDYGLFAVLDWLVDPFDTITMLASTTLGQLQMRSFESVIRYFNILKRHPRFAVPGKYIATKCIILNESEEDDVAADATPKASIRGVAVKQGTMEDARARLQGAHLPYVRLILDELSAMPEAAIEVRHNLRMGARDFRVFGLCNPEHLQDLACRHSVPVDGWASVSSETSTYWRTKWGEVRRHDGFKSPAIIEPGGAEKYPYLAKQSDLDTMLKEKGDDPDSPALWTMFRGWPPPQGSDNTVLSSVMIKSFGMADNVVWGLQDPVQAHGLSVRQLESTEPILTAGLDPAFTSGGDQAILQPSMVGYEATTQKLVINFLPEIVIPLKASSPRPMVYQVVDFCLEWAIDNDMDLKYLGVDESGTQRVGDMIEVEHLHRTGQQVTVCRTSFGSRASEFPVSLRNPKMAKEEYANQSTELWYLMQLYGSYNMIRGLPVEAQDQFCRRRVSIKRPRALETKVKMKARIGRSPDNADACAVDLAVVRWVLNVMPGATRFEPHGEQGAKNVNISLDRFNLPDIYAPDSMYKNSGFDAPVNY